MTPKDLKKNNDNTTQLNKIISALKSFTWRYPNWTVLSFLHWNVRARIGATCWRRLVEQNSGSTDCCQRIQSNESMNLRAVFCITCIARYYLQRFPQSTRYNSYVTVPQHHRPPTRPSSHRLVNFQDIGIFKQNGTCVYYFMYKSATNKQTQD